MSRIASADAAFDADAAWELASSVSLRGEPFGALAYDFRTRKLSFLKSLELVRVVELLGVSPSASAALAAAGVSAAERSRYLAALASLARSAMITPRSASVGAR
jgi:putative mycofactocin binding protein MftB